MEILAIIFLTGVLPMLLLLASFVIGYESMLWALKKIRLFRRIHRERCRGF